MVTGCSGVALSLWLGWRCAVRWSKESRWLECDGCYTLFQLPPVLTLSCTPLPPCAARSREEETNQTVIEGMGELHLEIIVDRLRREWKVECDVGAPQVSQWG